MDPSSSSSSPSSLRFSNLRSVRWRINLGILPTSSSSSIEDLRRVAADSRRRYARLRRRLLVDPHHRKVESKSTNIEIDNPLSQNPDSTWSRFFRNAEMEKMVDQDLSRLYPEHGSYFQTPACQALLRRILLLWCLRHPQYGYRQGMHELLAPLLFVLHTDVKFLHELQKKYEDHFIDECDGKSTDEYNFASDQKFAKNVNCFSSNDDKNPCQSILTKNSMDNVDPEIRTIILSNDSYGAEGELGILLSDKFLEHDAYSMFDALMDGAHGVIAVAEFFYPPVVGFSSGLSPVIDASSAMYHLLSIVDSSVHSHLLALGVEPQFFALRWFRVLFGREFSLENLLIIWDEIFSSANGICHSGTGENLHSHFKVLSSPSGAFTLSLAVAMILHLRSSLLATENATACLQKLLNFPENANVKKLIEKAKSLKVVALEKNVNVMHSSERVSNNNLLANGDPRLSCDSISPNSPLYSLPESYWEEKWRVLHIEEDSKELQEAPRNSFSKFVMKGLAKGRLSWSGPDISALKNGNEKKDSHSAIRGKLLDDLSVEPDPMVRLDEFEHRECSDTADKTHSKVEVTREIDYSNSTMIHCTAKKIVDHAMETTCLLGEGSLFSRATSVRSMSSDHNIDSENCSVTSYSVVGDNDETNSNISYCSNINRALYEDFASSSIVKHEPAMNAIEKRTLSSKEKKLSQGKFHWFWKFGRGMGEGNMDKRGSMDQHKISIIGNNQKDLSELSKRRVEKGDKKAARRTFRNLGQSMVVNIQVIESVLQQSEDQAGSFNDLPSKRLGNKGQVAALKALEELRKISTFLSEM